MDRRLSDPRRRLLLHAALLWLAFIVCARFYFHFASDNGGSLHVTRTPVSYYSQLAEAFRHGRLSLLTQPPRELLALPDPYNPALNAPFRLHDASLYRGRYYLYFGPAPALVLYLPFQLLTGGYLLDEAAVLIFLMAGLGFWLAVFHSAIREWFPHLSLPWTLLGGLAIGFCNTAPFVLARPAVYESCLACAYCFTAIFFKALMSALSGGPSRRNLLAAGVALSLAIASRPPALLIALISGAALLWHLHRDRTSWRDPVRQLLPFVIPLAVTGALLGTYNYMRFDNPLQFGNAYQLAGIYLRNVAFFGKDLIPSGLHYYILSSHRTGLEFPFVWTAPDMLARMPRSGSVEPVSGALPLYPFLAALLVSPAVLRRGAGARSGLRLLAIVLTAAGAAELLLLCGFIGVTMRYELEFLPPLVMAAVLAICLIVTSPSRWRWAGVVLAPALVAGALQGCLLGFSGYSGSYEQRHPGRTAAIQLSLLPVENRLARWFGGYGGIRLSLETKPGAPGQTQILVSTGVDETENRVLMRYLDPGTAQFGCAAHDRQGVYGDPVRLAPGSRHTLEIYTGAMYPDSRVIYASWFAPETYGFSQARCLVKVDGAVVTDIKPFQSSPSAPWRVVANTNGLFRNPKLAGPSQVLSSQRIVAPPQL
jgi:hypothetical protein